MAAECCEDTIAKVEGKKPDAVPPVVMPEGANEVQAKTREAEDKEKEDAAAAKGDGKGPAPVPTGPPGAPVAAPAINAPKAPGGAPPAPGKVNGKEPHAHEASGKLPAHGGGGAHGHAGGGSGGLDAAIAGAEGDVLGFLEKYEPKAKEPKERETKVNELAGMAGGFKEKLADLKTGGGFLSSTMGKIKDAFDVTKDVKDMLQGFKDNPYEKSQDTLGKVAKIVFNVREVTGMIGGICGKVGLACTILGLLTCWVPPLAAALQVIGRVLNIIGIVCDVLNLVTSAILIALNAMRLANPKLNPEEKAAIADNIIKDATSAAGSVMSLAMTFGGKFLGPLKNAKNSILGPIQKWIGAAIRRVKAVIGGFAKKIGMKIVHALGMGVKKAAAAGEKGLLGKAFDAVKKVPGKWGEKFAESEALSEKWGKGMKLDKVEGVFGLGAKAEKGAQKLEDKLEGNVSKPGSWRAKLEQSAADMDKKTMAMEKRFAVEEAQEAEKAQIKYEAKQALKEEKKAGKDLLSGGGKHTAKDGEKVLTEAERQEAAFKKFDEAAAKSEDLQKELEKSKTRAGSERVNDKAAETGKKFDEEHKIDGKTGMPTTVEKEREAQIKGDAEKTEEKFTTTQEQGAKKEMEEKGKELHDLRAEAKANPSFDKENFAKQQEAKAAYAKARAEYEEVQHARETLKQKSKFISDEMKKKHPDANAIIKAQEKIEKAEALLGKSTKTMEQYQKEQLAAAERTLKIDPHDADALTQKAMAEQALEPLQETRKIVGKDGMKDAVEEIKAGLIEDPEKEKEADERSESIIHKYGADHDEEKEKHEKAEERAHLAEETRALVKEVHVSATTSADVDAALAGIGEGGEHEHAHEHEDHDDGGGHDGPDGEGHDHATAVVGHNDAPPQIHAGPVNEGGDPGQGGGPAHTPEPAPVAHAPAAHKEEAKPGAAAGGEEGGGGGGGEELPFWPSLSGVHQREMKTLEDAKNTLKQFKAAQMDAAEKAKQYEQQVGAIKEQRQKKAEGAKKNQEEGKTAAADNRGGIPGANQVNAEGGKGEGEKGKGQGAASEKVTVDVPEPKSEGWFSAILNGIKRWFCNMAKKVMTTVQNAIADGILRLIMGVSMKDMQAYAECQRGMKERGGKAGDQAEAKSGQGVEKEKQTEAKTDDEKAKAQQATQEALANAQQADMLLSGVEEQEAAVKAEDAATKAFIAQVVAGKKEEEAKKREEEAKRLADAAKAKGEEDKAQKDHADAAKHAADAKQSKTPNAGSGGKGKGKGKTPKQPKPDAAKAQEAGLVDQAKLKAAAGMVLSHADSYTALLEENAQEQGGAVRKLAHKRAKSAGGDADAVAQAAVNIVGGYKDSANAAKQQADQVKGATPHSKGQVVQMAAELRKSAKDVDEAAQRAADALNRAFRIAWEKIGNAPPSTISNLVDGGKTAFSAIGMLKKVASAATPSAD